MSDHAHDDAHSPAHYWKIARLLMILAFVSYVGPMIGDLVGLKAITLISAFGIAFVKAFLVIKHFMHLTVEKKYVMYMLTTAIAFMFLFYAGTSSDVQNHEGRNWVNVAAIAEIERAEAAIAAGGEHGAHGGDHAEDGDHAEPAEGTHH